MVDLLQAHSYWNTIGIPMDKNTTPHSLHVGSGSEVTRYGIVGQGWSSLASTNDSASLRLFRT